ncbi:MAG TPA: outer membrane lipoprotein-sorting protein, partial [Myxococcota bacterium]|nr:outer membrane lipoprotein-sorting protein [Myxococcota bacterium]
LSFLLQPGADGGPIIEYYRSPRLFPPDRRTGRTLEVQVASAIERLPFAPGLPALAELWPARSEGESLARLGDERVDGVPCRVLERRLRQPDGAYDRVVTLLARDSDLALESRFYLGDKLVRRVSVAAKDVDQSEGRPVARRRVVAQSGDADQVLTLERFSLDPVFPDQLFTSQNLRIGRFPSY